MPLNLRSWCPRGSILLGLARHSTLIAGAHHPRHKAPSSVLAAPHYAGKVMGPLACVFTGCRVLCSLLFDLQQRGTFTSLYPRPTQAAGSPQVSFQLQGPLCCPPCRLGHAQYVLIYCAPKTQRPLSPTTPIPLLVSPTRFFPSRMEQCGLTHHEIGAVFSAENMQ